MTRSDTANEIKLDRRRRERIGLDEAIFCAHKADAQLVDILARHIADAASCLLTRLSPAQFARLPQTQRVQLDYDPVSATAMLNPPPDVARVPELAVVSAGSSDVPVAREAIRTLAYHGVAAEPIFDVGVAGLWRLMERLDDLERFPIAIVVAGMDAALPSVLGGLLPGLVIAVPTSVGYGVAAGGQTALNAILSSCAPGIVVVNIDNGYGAACAAIRALRLKALSTGTDI